MIEILAIGSLPSILPVLTASAAGCVALRASRESNEQYCKRSPQPTYGVGQAESEPKQEHRIAGDLVAACAFPFSLSTTQVLGSPRLRRKRQSAFLHLDVQETWLVGRMGGDGVFVLFCCSES